MPGPWPNSICCGVPRVKQYQTSAQIAPRPVAQSGPTRRKLSSPPRLTPKPLTATSRAAVSMAAATQHRRWAVRLVFDGFRLEHSAQSAAAARQTAIIAAAGSGWASAAKGCSVRSSGQRVESTPIASCAAAQPPANSAYRASSPAVSGTASSRRNAAPARPSAAKPESSDAIPKKPSSVQRNAAVRSPADFPATKRCSASGSQRQRYALR